MRHFIDIDTDQLRRLYTLLFDKKEMADIVKKLKRHIDIVNASNKK